MVLGDVPDALSPQQSCSGNEEAYRDFGPVEIHQRAPPPPPPYHQKEENGYNDTNRTPGAFKLFGLPLA